VFNIKELNIFIPVPSLPARSGLRSHYGGEGSRFGEGRPWGILTGVNLPLNLI